MSAPTRLPVEYHATPSADDSEYVINGVKL
jgi:hypothetical protein